MIFAGFGCFGCKDTVDVNVNKKACDGKCKVEVKKCACPNSYGTCTRNKDLSVSGVPCKCGEQACVNCVK